MSKAPGMSSQHSVWTRQIASSQGHPRLERGLPAQPRQELESVEPETTNLAEPLITQNPSRVES